MNRTLHIGVGLPGSGKTTLLKSIEGFYIDFDCIYLHQNAKSMEFELQHKFKCNLNYSDYVIDGLFLSPKSVLKLVDCVTNVISINKVVIYYWNPDVEQCLKNDKLRNRDKLADITIKNAKLAHPDVFVDSILTDFPKLQVDLQMHEVYK